jgi:DNA-binding transcriptional ArsR family regulator
MKQWTHIFKIFSNINRAKIVKLLAHNKAMIVGDIAHELGISFTSTSKHLIILDRLDVLNSRGTAGHVFYELNRNMPKDIKKIVDLFI